MHWLEVEFGTNVSVTAERPEKCPQGARARGKQLVASEA